MIMNYQYYLIKHIIDAISCSDLENAIAHLDWLNYNLDNS